MKVYVKTHREETIFQDVTSVRHVQYNSPKALGDNPMVSSRIWIIIESELYTPVVFPLFDMRAMHVGED